MTLNIVHVHGFKCAGTTFSASLAANFKNDFRCIEPKTEGPLDWDKARQASQELGLRAMSSHSLRLPSILSSDIQLVIQFKKGISSTKGLLKCYNLHDEAE